MAQMGLTQALGALWDSRRQLPVFGAARTGIFPGIYLKAMGQRTYLAHLTNTASENELKILKVLPPWTVKILRKIEGNRRVLSSMGCQCTNVERSAFE